MLTRDIVAADDLVQDCLMSALHKIHMWEPGTDLRAWLFTILHNQHVNGLRGDARHRARIDLYKSYRTWKLAPDQNVRLEVRDVERALTKLPSDQRSLVLAIGLEGFSYEDAASAFNLPLGTVRSRLARGRLRLRLLTDQVSPGVSDVPDDRPNPIMPPRDMGTQQGSFPPRSQRAATMKFASLAIAAIAILSCLATAPANAQERGFEPPLHLPAINPSMSLAAPTANPLQEQMREDYAAGLTNDQRELLHQNPSGATREERAIEQQLDGYTPQ